ncbi:MAG: hypothetical protein L3J97_04485 [Thermoplasmata archaeon]|nr:hypothetical protein [Thermoplasmata archaeon]
MVSVLLGLLVVLVLGFADLNPVYFSGQVRTLSGLPGFPAGSPPGAPFIKAFPRGHTVTVHWTVAGAAEVEFDVIPPGSAAAYACQQRGSSDSCSFVSVGGNYTFRAFDIVSPSPSHIVNITGVYRTPLL